MLVVATANGFRLVDMSFMGTVGSVAQAAYAVGSAPTGVAIWTTGGPPYSADYEDACLVVIQRTGSGGENPLASNDGSDFSSQSATIELAYDVNYGAVLNANTGLLELIIRGNIHATNGLTYAWTTDNLTVVDSQSYLSAYGWLFTTASTDQDELDSSSGLVNAIRLYHSSGGRGYNLLAPGDTIAWTVDASATNAGGTTTAPQLDVTVEIS